MKHRESESTLTVGTRERPHPAQGLRLVSEKSPDFLASSPQASPTVRGHQGRVLPRWSGSRETPAEQTCPTPQINWEQPAEVIHNWIRGNDKMPGAWTEACGQVCSCMAGIGLDALVCPTDCKTVKICLNWLANSYFPEPQSHPSAPSHFSP